MSDAMFEQSRHLRDLLQKEQAEVARLRLQVIALEERANSAFYAAGEMIDFLKAHGYPRDVYARLQQACAVTKGDLQP